MWSASFASWSGSGWSVTVKIRSNREINAGSRSICSPIGSYWSNRPYLGFAAPNNEHRDLSVAFIPALLILMDCCSSASCIAERSSSAILSSSSMAATPLSASTNAPASNVHCWPSPKSSRTAAAVLCVTTPFATKLFVSGTVRSYSSFSPVSTAATTSCHRRSDSTTDSTSDSASPRSRSRCMETARPRPGSSPRTTTLWYDPATGTSAAAS